MSDRALLFGAVGLVAVNLYITWRIAQGLQQVSNTVDTARQSLQQSPLGLGLSALGVNFNG